MKTSRKEENRPCLQSSFTGFRIGNVPFQSCIFKPTVFLNATTNRPGYLVSLGQNFMDFDLCFGGRVKSDTNSLVPSLSSCCSFWARFFKFKKLSKGVRVIMSSYSWNRTETEPDLGQPFLQFFENVAKWRCQPQRNSFYSFRWRSLKKLIGKLACEADTFQETIEFPLQRYSLDIFSDIGWFGV